MDTRAVASAPAASLEDLWASDVFTLDRMKAVLLGRVYKWVRSTIEKAASSTSRWPMWWLRR
jgi:glutamine synthetase type III